MPGIIYNGSDPTLLALTKFQSLNVDDDFMSQLKGAYSSCIFMMRLLVGGRDS